MLSEITMRKNGDKVDMSRGAVAATKPRVPVYGTIHLLAPTQSNKNQQSENRYSLSDWDCRYQDVKRLREKDNIIITTNDAAK